MGADLDSLEALERECDMEFLRGSGPGGQHRNKVETGVRLRHLPTGIVVTAMERRSQARNRKLALERLRDRLEERNRPRKARVPTRPPAASRKQRLADKKATGEKKRLRSKVDDE